MIKVKKDKKGLHKVTFEGLTDGQLIAMQNAFQSWAENGGSTIAAEFVEFLHAGMREAGVKDSTFVNLPPQTDLDSED